MNFYLTAVFLGLGFAALGMGIFVSMRIFRIPDITTDGSFTLGAAVTAVCIQNNLPLSISLFFAFISGFLAGSFTGIIHTKLKVNALLAGIIVMTALYSVNLSIMGKPNLPLINVNTLFSGFFGIENPTIKYAIVLLLFVFVLWALLFFVLRTDFGIAMRATGENEVMARAQGINTHKMQIFGIGLANGLVALSGYLICQYQGFADINMGIGIVIIGLGSVMIGESILNVFNIHALGVRLAGIIAGSIIFRILLAMALDSGLSANYLKLVTAILVLLFVGVPVIIKKKSTA